MRHNVCKDTFLAIGGIDMDVCIYFKAFDIS